MFTKKSEPDTGGGQGDKKPHGVRAIIEIELQRKRDIQEKWRKGSEAVKNTKGMLVHHAKGDLMIKRTVHQWSPWAVSGALMAIAAANTLAAQISGDPFGTGATTLTSAVGVLGLAVMAIKRSKRLHRIAVPADPVRRRWMVLCIGAAMAWLSVAVVVGLDVDTTGPLMALALAMGTVVLARDHWRRHRIADPQPRRPERAVEQGAAGELAAAPSDGDDEGRGGGAEHEEEQDEEIRNVEDLIDRWETNVSAPGGSVRGSSLEFEDFIGGVDDDGNPIHVGKRFRLHLPRQGVTFASVMAQKEQIGVSMGLPPESMTVERRQPSEENPRPDPGILHFDIVDNSPTDKSVLVTGSRYKCVRDENGDVKDAWINCGPYFNGDGQATWRVYDGGSSMWGGFLVGGTGSGKTVLLDLIAFSLAASGHTAIWYADGQGGASSQFIPKIADWTLKDEDGFEDLLTALEYVQKVRAAENEREGLTGFVPSPERPGLAVIVDECQLVLNPENAKRWESLSKVARKVGIALIMATQAAQFDSFGRSENLRQQLLAGNVLVLRTTGVTQKGFIPGLEADPTSLPAIPGFGYTAANSKGQGRTAAFRGGFCPDYAALWDTLGLEMVFPDKGVRGAANHATDNRYHRREELAEERFETIGEELQDVYSWADGGAPERGRERRPEPDTGAAANSGRARREPVEKVTRRINADVQGVDTERMDELLARFNAEVQANDAAIARGDTGPQEPMTIERELSGLNDLEDAVLGHILQQGFKEEWASTGGCQQAAEEVRPGIHRQRVDEALKSLSGKALVAKKGHGKWGLTESMEEHIASKV